ncbi:helix-turn-helix transcriptional regulator [Spirillospora sp. NPDC127200]
MLETSARLLRLLSLLQTPREWPGAELAERLEVSRRTVRNDVERLRSLGYPVRAARGPAGGYRLEAGTAMPPLLLDDEEAVAVAVGLRAAAGAAVAGIDESALRALAKLERVLPSRLRRRVNTLQTYTVPVPRDDRAPAVDPEVLSTLAAACRDGERVRFGYRDHTGSATDRLTEPYRLVNWGRRWYLVAFDVERDGWRTFRVDRLALRTPTGARSVPREPPSEDIAAYVSQRVSAAAWRVRARVRLHAPAEAIAERFSPALGVLEAVDERTCVLDTGADSAETLAVHLGMLGVDFEVSEPPELVAHLESLSARYARAVDPAR